MMAVVLKGWVVALWGREGMLADALIGDEGLWLIL
jgi:hypothetical protein